MGTFPNPLKGKEVNMKFNIKTDIKYHVSEIVLPNGTTVPKEQYIKDKFSPKINLEASRSIGENTTQEAGTSEETQK